MNAIPDHYAALGIDPSADQEVIAAAYRALAKKYHPDTGATTGTASAERFDQVQRAYEVLRTPESRRQYDLELLAQAERELEAHLARKRRALPGSAAASSSSGTPDLGAIRPEPPGAATQARKVRPDAGPAKRRPIAPFLIPVVLLLALMGAAAWLFLPKPPEAPPAPMAESAAPAKPPQDSSVAKPVFGSTSAESGAVATGAPQQTAVKGDVEATPPAEAASPVPKPAAAEGTIAEEASKPVFGSTASAPAEEAQADPGDAAPAAVAPAPTPKPRPVKPKAAPAPKPAPVQRAENSSAYTLIIYERRRGGRIRTHEADMLFASRGSCIEFGVQAVLRRMGAREINPRKPRIWYECQPAS